MTGVASGERILSAHNNDLEARIAAMEAAWPSWTPTLANLTLGTGGTVVAVYRQVGKTVDWRFKFTLGSGSAVGTNPAFTPPVTPSTTLYSADDKVGDAGLADAGAALYPGVTYWTGTHFRIAAIGAGSTYASKVDITSTIPINAWGSGDSMSSWGTYIVD